MMPTKTTKQKTMIKRFDMMFSFIDEWNE